MSIYSKLLNCHYSNNKKDYNNLIKQFINEYGNRETLFEGKQNELYKIAAIANDKVINRKFKIYKKQLENIYP